MTAHDATIEQNIRSVAEIEARQRSRRTAFERVTDFVTRAMGSGPVVVGHLIWFAGWGLLNSPGITGRTPFDPFPYSFLTLVVSLEAIVLTALVLRAQSHMAAESDNRARVDLQVNLLAEQESTATLRMLSALCRAQGVPIDERLSGLLERVDVREIADEVEHESEDPAKRPA